MAELSIRDLLDEASIKSANVANHSRHDTRPFECSYPASSKFPLNLSVNVLSGLLLCFELSLLAVLSDSFASAIMEHSIYASLPSVVFTFLTAALTILALRSQGAYSSKILQSPALPYTRLIASWSAAFLGSTALFAFTRDRLLDDWRQLASWYVCGLLALVATRAVTAVLVARLGRTGRLNRRTAIVGGGIPAEGLIQALDAQPSSGVQVLGIFDDRDDTRSPAVVASYPKLGRVADLPDFARQHRLDLIIITLPITAEERILQVLRDLWVLPVDIRLSAHASKLKLRRRSYSYIGQVPVLDLIDKPIGDWGLISKWLFDKLFGLALLVALAPVFATVAIMVKLDSPGPVLFRQRRYGFNNELIEVFKFRSLYTDQSDNSSEKQVTKDDPRVTRVGRLIRKTSLDELPQLFNVVFHDNLSLVGPRPHALRSKAGDYLFDEVVESYFARHKVKPGVTGWAQIHGWRGETDTEEKLRRRVECDLHYIESWSLLLDLYILFVTPLALLRTRNAY